MTDRNQTQADLLDGFMETLSSGQTAPPANLDPALAAVAITLSAEMTPPAPSARFVRGLEQRLAAIATDANNHDAMLPPAGDSEPAGTRSGAGWQVIETDRRSRFSELARLMAAVVVMLLIGSVLIFMFSDREGDSANVAAPRPTPVDAAATHFSNDILVSWDPNGGDKHKLYIFDALGEKAPRRLTADPVGDTEVVERLGTWSPEGQRIAYLMVSQSAELVVISADGTEMINLSLMTGLDEVQTFSWSPDSKRIAFSTNAGGHQGLHVVGADGSDLQTIASGHLVIDIAWGPSGSVLAFATLDSRYPTLYTVDADGSNLRQHATSLGPSDLKWSPTGEYISYTAIGGPPVNSYVYRFDPVSGDERPLTSGSVLSSGARWWRDGRQLVFTIHDLGESLDGTMISDTDGSNQRLVTPLSGRHDWSSDGSRLVIVSSNRVNAGTAGPTSNMTIMLIDGQVLDSPLMEASIDGWPAWRPSHPAEPDRISGPIPPAEATPVMEPTKTPQILTEPPRALLTCEDQTQSSGAHSYCWPDPSSGEDAVICEQPTREPPALPALHVPRGANLGFTLEGVDQYTIRGASGVALVPFADAPDTGMTFEFPGTDISFEQGPDGAVIVADVPDGDYSFEIGITMEVLPGQQGEASYAFRVVVGEPEAPAPGEATAVPPSEGSIPTTLSYEVQTQTGVFAYGCNWAGDPVCVDPGGMPFPMEPIEVPEGRDFIFSIEGLDDFEARNYQATAYPMPDSVEAQGDALFMPFPAPDAIVLPTFGTPEAMHVVAHLPPGNYVIDMTITGEGGSGTYGFHVRVTGISEPSLTPDTIGTIAQIEDRDFGRSVYIIEHPEDPDAGDQYYVSVTEQTPVFERTSDGVGRRTAADLQPGMRITVAFYGDVAESYPAYASSAEVVIVRTETDGPRDPNDLVVMTFRHSLITGFAPIPAGDAFYVDYSIAGGASSEAYLCADDERAEQPCTSGYGFETTVEVPRGAELHFAIYRLSRDNPDVPGVVKQGLVVVDADMLTRSWYRYGASNPGGY